jgi:hypothetical protein
MIFLYVNIKVSISVHGIYEVLTESSLEIFRENTGNHSLSRTIVLNDVELLDA